MKYWTQGTLGCCEVLETLAPELLHSQTLREGRPASKKSFGHRYREVFVKVPPQLTAMHAVEARTAEHDHSDP
jgi:hypothetical protein